MSVGCRSTYEASSRGSGDHRRRWHGVRATLLGLAAIVLVAVCAPSAALGATSPSQQWATSTGPAITGAGGTMPLVFGSTGVIGTTLATRGDEDNPPGPGWPAPYPVPADSTIPANLEPDPPAGSFGVGDGRCCTPGLTGVQVFTFNKPIIAPNVHALNLDATRLTVSGSTTAGAPITLTTLGSNIWMDVSGNTLNNSTEGAYGTQTCRLNDLSNVASSSGACGSFRLNGPGETVKAFTLTNVEGTGGGDGWAYLVSFPTAPLTKQFSPARIPVGGTSQLTFTIANPNNPSQVDLSPLDFTDVLPAGITLANGSVTNNGKCGAPAVTDSGGASLDAGDAGVRAANMSVAVGDTCTITVNVTSTTPGNYVNDNNNLSTGVGNLLPDASTPLEVYAVADVKVEKSTTAPLVAGEEGTYNLKVTNNGPSPAVNVKVTDKLPGAESFVSASSGCSEASKTVTCTLASLAPGASHTFTVSVRVASSANSCSDVENSATVTNDVFDPELTNNTSKICNFERRSNLKITKIPSRTSVPKDGQLMYTLVVQNRGPSDNDNVKLTDPMAAGLSLVSAKPGQGSCSTTGGKVSCDLGTLAAGGSTQVLVTATVTSTATSSGGACTSAGRSDSITNTATVTGDSFDPDTSDNKGSATVCPGPGPDPTFDLVAAKTAASKSVYVGQALKYTITVTNKGPASAPNAKLTDTLNHPASVVSVKTSQGSCTKTLPMTCQLGTIKAGGKVTITATVKLRDDGCTQRNVASTTGEGTDTNPANNLARIDVCAKPVPLRLTKVADRGSVRAGSLVGYTIRVSNPSAGEAQNVKVCDKLPSGLVYVSSKATAKFSNGQYCWTIKTLGAHKSESFRITVRALGSASGDRVNRATASATGAKTARAKDPVRVLGARASGGGVTG
jgi:uncharacterized repeat protein (TIGR01451 family)